MDASVYFNYLLGVINHTLNVAECDKFNITN